MYRPDKRRNGKNDVTRFLTIQAMGLKKRLEHTHSQSAVIGISGGLDSTLALLVTARAFDFLGMPREQITGSHNACVSELQTVRIVMPASLTKNLGATLAGSRYP
ncbi:MAG: hypothetical protein ACLRPV_05690 [Lacrimispora saccharolytica]